MWTALLFKLGKIEIRGSVRWFEMATARPAWQCWASNACLALQSLQSEYSIDALTAATGLPLTLWTQETLSGGCKIHLTVVPDEVHRRAEEAYSCPDFQMAAGFNVHPAVAVVIIHEARRRAEGMNVCGTSWSNYFCQRLFSFITNKSATVIILNGKIKTFICAVFLAVQHTRRAVGRGGQNGMRLALFHVWPPALNWEKKNELIPAFIFIVSGDSLMLRLIRWDNWMAACMQHTQKNGLYHINQMIYYLILRTPWTWPPKSSMMHRHYSMNQHSTFDVWPLFTALFNNDALHLNMASISLCWTLCAEFLTALAYFFIWFSSGSSCCWSSGCLSQNLFAYIYDPVHPGGTCRL